MKRNRVILLYYLLIPISLLIICCLLLYISGLIPQSLVNKNFAPSARQRNYEGLHPHYINQSFANSRVDGFTESLILMSSYYMDTTKKPANILLNPLYIEQEPLINETLLKMTEQEIEPNATYVRYWMGFRIIIRPLLAFFHYDEIRYVLSIVFLLLFSLSVIVFYKFSGTSRALSFAISVAMMNLSVISYSIDHSICFLLTFVFLIAVPLIRLKIDSVFHPLVFLSFGMLTQFFDFYTSPLITFAFPFMLLYSILYEKESAFRAKKLFYIAIIYFFSWLAGYVIMWLMKLSLTSMFTPINGLLDGFSAFTRRVGIEKIPTLSQYYNPLMALEGVFRSFFGSKSILIFFIFIFSVIALPLFIHMVYRRKIGAWINNHNIYITLALLPLIWFILAAQPTSIHAYFQYRSISVTVYCLFVVFFGSLKTLKYEKDS